MTIIESLKADIAFRYLLQRPAHDVAESPIAHLEVMERHGWVRWERINCPNPRWTERRWTLTQAGREEAARRGVQNV